MNLIVVDLVLVPLIAVAIILCLPSKQTFWIKTFAISATFLTLIGAFVLFFNYKPSSEIQFEYIRLWLPQLGISFHSGLDGIGMVMVLLHAILSFAGALISRNITNNIKLYFIFYLLLVSSIFGVFTSLDIFFLYLFYEMAVIPLYPLIGIWGSQNREYAAMKLTLYISLGAVVALVGLVALYLKAGIGTFDLIVLTEHIKLNGLPYEFQLWCAPLLIFGFAVVASLWPFHSWSPIGYAAAPTAVSMLHAGVLKKLGIFLIIRLVLPLMPAGAQFWMPWVAVLCVINILYGAWAAMAQKDMKYAIGFASVSHMGYAFLGLACLNQLGLTATVFFMFAHGVMAALCFALIGFIYDQTHTRQIPELGGLAKQMPFISVCFVMAAFASSGLPGFGNFVSEMLIFFAAWKIYSWQTILAIFGIVITATYMLRMIRNVFFGPAHAKWSKLNDAKSVTERFPFAFLLIVLMIVGCWPSILLKVIEPTTKPLIETHYQIQIINNIPTQNATESF